MAADYGGRGMRQAGSVFLITFVGLYDLVEEGNTHLESRDT